ncbi:cytochrome P450 [Mycobacterium sp. NPDC003323]
MSGRASDTSSPARLSGTAALAALVDIGGASFAAGVLARRRRMVGVLERLQADRRALTRIRHLRERFGRGPVELAIPGRSVAVILDAADVGTVLAQSPDPFHPASWEKRKALEKFQPHAVLVSRGDARERRRELNEAVLDSSMPMHHLAETFARVVSEESQSLAAHALDAGVLSADELTRTWWRIARRVTLGDDARDDHAVTDDLWRLRRAGNWSFLGRSHRHLRERFSDRLYDYAASADAHSLIGTLARSPRDGSVDPIGQVPHWLFAFDAAGMALIRTAALLSTHPEVLGRCELTDPEQVQVRPMLRASVLESVRLWPTTPAILRELTADTRLGPDRPLLPRGASVLIAAPVFHRDPDLPFAHTFAPDIWLNGIAQEHPELVPFSAGPAECPGRNLVLLTTSSALAQLFSTMHLELRSTPDLDPNHPLPLTLNQFGVEFRATAPYAAVSHG